MDDTTADTEMPPRLRGLVDKLMDHVQAQAAEAYPLPGQRPADQGPLDWSNPSAVYLQLDSQVRMLRDMARIPGEKLADPDSRIRVQAALQCMAAGYLLLLSVDSDPDSVALPSGGTVADLTARHGLRYRQLARLLLDHEVDCPGHAHPTGEPKFTVEVHVPPVDAAPCGGHGEQPDGSDGCAR